MVLCLGIIAQEGDVMDDCVRFKVRWKKCTVPVGEFFCITGDTDTGVIAACRENFDAPYEVSCLLSDIDNSKVHVNKISQILTVMQYDDRVVMKYFNNKKILTEKVYSLT